MLFISSTLHVIIVLLALYARRRFVFYDSDFHAGWAAFTFPVVTTATVATLFAKKSANGAVSAQVLAWVEVVGGALIAVFVIIRWATRLLVWVKPLGEQLMQHTLSNAQDMVGDPSSTLPADTSLARLQRRGAWVYTTAGTLRLAMATSYAFEAPMPYRVTGDDPDYWWEANNHNRQKMNATMNDRHSSIAIGRRSEILLGRPAQVHSSTIS